MHTVSSPVLQSKKSGRSERPQGTNSEDSRKSFTTTLLVLCPMPIFESSSDSEASSTRMKQNDTEFEFNRQKITSKICAALVWRLDFYLCGKPHKACQAWLMKTLVKWWTKTSRCCKHVGQAQDGTSTMLATRILFVIMVAYRKTPWVWSWF